MKYRTCGPQCPDHTGRLLDLPVWTDTKGDVGSTSSRHLRQQGPDISFGVSRGCRGCTDPYHLVCCDACGLPLERCYCVPGKDY